MTVIIGIDPGSRQTGYGVIRIDGQQQLYMASGYLKLRDESHPERLKQLFRGLQEVVQSYAPHEAAIEQIFMHRNPSSALKLGQARGAAIVALEVPVSEYSAREIKQSVVGYGAANKDQVQFMVQRLLKLSGKIQADAADALAIALCHAQSRLLRMRLSGK